jgi:hypothetical protein
VPRRLIEARSTCPAVSRIISAHQPRTGEPHPGAARGCAPRDRGRAAPRRRLRRGRGDRGRRPRPRRRRRGAGPPAAARPRRRPRGARSSWAARSSTPSRSRASRWSRSASGGPGGRALGGPREGCGARRCHRCAALADPFAPVCSGARRPSSRRCRPAGLQGSFATVQPSAAGPGVCGRDAAWHAAAEQAHAWATPLLIKPSASTSLYQH